ncbi:MAG: serpin family protein [Kiritimatiellia bacterium]|nr:serpin family protein [Kiritimatiellia bacterium]
MVRKIVVKAPVDWYFNHGSNHIRKEKAMRNRYKAIALSVLGLVILPGSIILAEPQLKDVDALVSANSTFALDLYQKLCPSEGNLFFSPYSISTALAMTYAGARENTEKEMASALHFSMKQENLHPAFADLEDRLNKLQKAGNINLGVANSLWPQKDYKFLPEYLALIKKNYGVSITPVDYMQAAEATREMINKWVEDKTQGKIKNLIPPGIFGKFTLLVLINAIYFKGDWESQFRPDATKDSPFFISPEKSVQIPIMNQKENFKYAQLESLQILELPYTGNELSMLVLLPKEKNGLQQLESILTVENLKQWKNQLGKEKVSVSLPKFKMTSSFSLNKTLKSMGMIDAFNVNDANFAGMDGRPASLLPLFIGAVFHNAFVDLNEEGTEAAAATAVMMAGGGLPPPPKTFCADHPFIFLIQDNQTGSILFMGRLTDPTYLNR